MPAADICDQLPPGRLQKIFSSACSGAINGALHGGANVLDHALQHRGVSANKAGIVSQVFFYGLFFTTRFYSYYAQEKQHAMPCDYSGAAWNAFFETGKLFVTQYFFKGLSWTLNIGANSLEKRNWPKLGKSIKAAGSLLRYGLFAYNALNDDIATTTATVAASTAAEIATEMAGTALHDSLSSSKIH